MSTAGIRIASAAMDAIGLFRNEDWLFAFYHAKTCAIDPIQFICGCTLGNSNIIVTDERTHALELVRQESGEGVKVALKEEALQLMRGCMALKRKSEKEDEAESKLALAKEFDVRFQTAIKTLKTIDTADIVEVTPVTIDVAPYLKKF